MRTIALTLFIAIALFASFAFAQEQKCTDSFSCWGGETNQCCGTNQCYNPAAGKCFQLNSGDYIICTLDSVLCNGEYCYVPSAGGDTCAEKATPTPAFNATTTAVPTTAAPTTTAAPGTTASPATTTAAPSSSEPASSVAPSTGPSTTVAPTAPLSGDNNARNSAVKATFIGAFIMSMIAVAVL